MNKPNYIYEENFKNPKREPVLVDYVRTPMGKKRGTIVRHRGDDLIIHCYNALLKRNDFDPNVIGDSIVACNSQIGECAMDIGRNAALGAHLPVKVPGMSVNRHCASGAQAVLSAWQSIATGIHDCVICGGIEVQNKYPIQSDTYIFDEEKGRPIMVPPNKKILTNPEVIESMDKYNARLASQINSAHVLGKHYFAKHKGIPMKEVKKDVRDEFKLQLDKLSVLSHEKACNTWEERGKEIEPIWCPKLDAETGEPLLDENKNVAQDPAISVLTEKDEGPRPGTSLEKVQKLRTIVGRRSEAYLTAANSCPTTDGAAGQIWMTRELAEEFGLQPLASIVNFSIIGSDPILMLDGPIYSMPKALDRANLTFDDMDFIEINEAFSPVVWACCKELGLDWEDPRFNPWGGAIALGHPTGMTGTRLIGTNAQQLLQNNKEYAISSMCVGFGMSTATIIQNEQLK